MAASATTAPPEQEQQQPQGGQGSQPGPGRRRQPPVCRFFGRGSGCRAGEQCRFLHSAPAAQQTRRQNSSTDTARRTQIGALLRASSWQAKRLSSEPGETAFSVELAPSDPDFPFDLERLHLALIVPATYPARQATDRMVEIEVANADIPLGVRRNVEAGFAAHVRDAAGAAIAAGSPESAPSLEDHLRWLDRNLEALMRQRPASTIKFTSFGPAPPAELQQLERRFRGSYAVVRETPDEGTVVRLTIAPTDPDMAGFGIARMTCTVSVARSYPQAPGPGGAAALELDEDSVVGADGRPAAWRPVEGRRAYLDRICQCFNAHVAEAPATSLLHHLNWLDRQLAGILAGPLPPAAAPEEGHPAPERPAEAKGRGKQRLPGDAEASKPWIRHVTAAEAGLPAAVAGLALDAGGSGAESDGSRDEQEASGSEDEQEAGANDDDGGGLPKPARRGIEVRLGAAEFTNVALAHCHSLSVAVRCARCKGSVELRGVAPTVRMDRDQQAWTACGTCSAVLGVRFRPDWMFAGRTTVGYLDCSGCAPTDLLPSKFTLACEACEARAGDNTGGAAGAAGAAGAVGVAANAVLSCRACYARMGVRLQEPQFVQLQRGVEMGGGAGAAQISRAAARAQQARGGRRAELARLGVVPGQPLPDRGACRHFARSQRWLRFPCCGKAYPCVTCHDAKEDHPHEYAQSMLCGHCAKEQPTARVQQSGLCCGCGAQLVQKTDGHRAFWQGGTGVRDHVRMSRKDPKKYQGLGKTVAQKKVATPK
ncbi:hypothetical protein H4R18_005574, partial [Coemansia javaensis]